MKTLLSIQSSIYSEQGQSGRLSSRLVEQWKARNPGGRVLIRDLAAEPVPHLTAERFAALSADPADRDETARWVAALSDRLISEWRRADQVVLGLPMYNFTIPSTLKAYFDHIARAGVTFRYTDNGPEGLLVDRPVHVFATRGGVYAGTDGDTQTALVRQFFGFLGIRDLHFHYAEGIGMGEAQRQKALELAWSSAQRLAA